MARKRLLSQEFFSDPHVGQLSKPARLLFLAFILQADDDGRFEVDANAMRRMAFGYDEDTASGVEQMIQELSGTLRNFHLYWVDDRRFGFFEKWRPEWQQISHPTASKLPPLEDGIRDSEYGLTEKSGTFRKLPTSIVKSSIVECSIVQSTTSVVKPKKNGSLSMPEAMIPVWDIYPKHEEKAYAIKKWLEFAAELPPTEQFIETLRWQIDVKQWTKEADRYQFIPAFGVYLNKRKWEDERPALTQGATNGRPLYNFEKNQGAGAGTDTGADYDAGGDGASPFDDAIFDD